VTLTTPPFRKIFRGHVGTIPGSMRAKFEVRIFSHFGAIIAFNTQNLRGHVTLAKPLFENFFGGHVGTIPRSMCAKFEVRIFSHFGAISI